MLERKLVTTLFADLVGSTVLAGELDAEQLREVMTRYRDALALEVRRFGGTMEKFIGDAAMAVFGFPQAHEDDPERAVRAAFAIRDAVRRLEDGRLQVRVGLYTGEVVADPAAGERGEFLVTGEAVHLAQRLQAAAEPGQILVGARTAKHARDGIVFEAVPALEVKGATLPLEAYQALQPREQPALRVPRYVEVLGRELDLVGRTFELQLLQLLFDKVCAERRPHLVTLVGPAGIGKTRLAEEFRSRIEGRQPPPLLRLGACKPYGESTLYCPIAPIMASEFPTTIGEARDPGPFVQVVSEAVRQVSAESGLGGAGVERLAQILAWCLRDDCLVDPQPRRDELLSAWRFPIEARSLRSPVVVTFDNVQWSSDEPLDFIESLPLKLADRPVLVIAVARPELLERRPRWAGGSGDATTLQLGPLSSEETRSLAAQVLGAPTDPSLLARLEERAEGNPHFVIEILRALIDEGTLVRSEDGWRLSEASEPKLPDTVQGVAAARIDALPSIEKRLLRLASYAAHARYFYDRPVRLMGDLSDVEIDAAIDGLLAKRLIKESSRPSPPAAFAVLTGTRMFQFSHGLLREVAREMVPKSERSRLEATFAAWLEDVVRELPDTAHQVEQVTAHHYYEAWRLAEERGRSDASLADRALRYCLRAAEIRVACHATREAVEDLRRAARVARASLPEREADVVARLVEVERLPVEAL